MLLRHRILKNTYRDSVALMQVAAELEGLPGIEGATLLMATANNLALARDAKLIDGDIETASNDLLIAVRANSETDLDAAFDLSEERLKDRLRVVGNGAERPSEPESLERGLADKPQSNLALISCPGEYATAEAMKALRLGLNVMMFSDNVSIEDELALKTHARDNDLMMMGPDCGTAIIDTVPLGFANVVKPGPVGVVAASGTGLQQVVCLLDRFDTGISQAIGVGGRDLTPEIGGITMIQGLHALASDDATRVIVLISKPPHPEIAQKLIGEAKSCGKPVVINFLGYSGQGVESENLHFAETLDKAAAIAVALTKGVAPVPDTERPLDEDVLEQLARLTPSQVNLRGLYSGGTFCYEAQLLFQDTIGPVWSSTPLKKDYALPDPQRSTGHTVVDLGDDHFTQGRPHPMIDQRTRIERIEFEAGDPTTAVILIDLVLGHGAHPDPATELVDAIQQVRKNAAKKGREILFVAFVCGTLGDPQNLSDQEAKLRASDVILASSNAAAVRLVSQIIRHIDQNQAPKVAEKIR